MTNLNKNLIEVDCMIDIPSLWNQKRHRQRDKFIMDEARFSGYSMEDMKSINRCRLYIKVIMFAYISNVDGTFMEFFCRL